MFVHWTCRLLITIQRRALLLIFMLRNHPKRWQLKWRKCCLKWRSPFDPGARTAIVLFSLQENFSLPICILIYSEIRLPFSFTANAGCSQTHIRRPTLMNQKVYLFWILVSFFFLHEFPLDIRRCLRTRETFDFMN